MPYTNDRIWDSKGGLVKRMKGLVIYRRKPKCNVSTQDFEDYENGLDNPSYPEKGDWKIGYTKRNNPISRYLRFIKKEERFNRVNNWLNKIPFVRVEVIEWINVILKNANDVWKELMFTQYMKYAIDVGR